MISPIRATPNMSVADLANVINDLADQLEAENRTKVIKDENGVNRIIEGRFPDGTYGYAITQEGIDVLEAIEE